jgi:HPt (histidine-containing phosphotransfer) domain-containing protein
MKKPPLNQIDDQINTLLADLWHKNLPTLRERLDLLDLIASSASSGTIPAASRDEAITIAHKLSGSLGMFGYQQGTEIAAKIERILKAALPEDLATLPDLTADLRRSLPTAL